MYDVKKVRSDFPMLRAKKQMQGHDLVFLDNASTTFKPDAVIEAVRRYYEDETSNAHRGDYDLCYHADMAIASARKTLASFLGADDEEIVFTAGTTDGLNLVAEAYCRQILSPGDEILISKAEHASNLLPWFRLAKQTGAVLRYVSLDDKYRILPSAVKDALNEKTKVVSFAGIGNVLGHVLPIREIANLVHSVGAIFVVDGAQLVPHLKVDVKELDCDFLAFSGHKMCGPTGIGVLYGKKELLSTADPYRLGGGMNVKFYANGEASYLPAPARFEAGTQHIAGIYGLKAAVDYLNALGMEHVLEHERELKRYAVTRFESLSNAIVYNADAESGILTFNIRDVFAQDAGTFLNAKGIACRSGQHCAKILGEELGEIATVRASFYLYTTKEEIDALAEAVQEGGNYLDAYF